LWNAFPKPNTMIPLRGSQRSLTWKGSGQEWTRQDTKGLTHSGREWQNTYREGQQAGDQLAKFYFSQPALYKGGRDLNIKTLWPSYKLSIFASLYCHCQCPWLSINFFSVKGNHLAFLPTVIETWCTCRFQPCRNAAKPQQPCQTVAFGSQHPMFLLFYSVDVVN
jgi:hypothetical protein